MAEKLKKDTKKAAKQTVKKVPAGPVKGAGKQDCVDCSVLVDCCSGECSVKSGEDKWLGKVLTAKNSSFDEALKIAFDNNRPLLVQFGYDGCGECEAYNRSVTDTKAWSAFLKAKRIVMYRTTTAAEMNAVYRKYSSKDYKVESSYPWLVMYGPEMNGSKPSARTALVEKTFNGLLLASAVKGKLWTAQGIGPGGVSTLFGVSLPLTKDMSSRDIENLVNAWFPNNFWDSL